VQRARHDWRAGLVLTRLRHPAEKTRKGWGAWIHWNRKECQPDAALVEASRPEDLVNRNAVLAYVEQLRTVNSSMTVCNRVQELYDGVRAMSPSVAESNWDWLKNTFKNLRSEARPSRNKVARLRTADELEELGFWLMAEADIAGCQKDHDNRAMTSLQRALAFRDGLMIALLIRRPFRIRNFASLQIGKTLIMGDGTASFTFLAAKMKGKRPLDVALPPTLFSALIRYLDNYRQILLSDSGKAKGLATDALWISRDGTKLAEVSLHKVIRRRTWEAFGSPIPLHWFRDCAVTTLVRNEPASALLTGSILGHTSPDIATRHYSQALMIDSARRHAAVLESYLDDGLLSMGREK
jgi:hypothetical protein